MGPTIYVWIRLASVMWPRTDIKSSLCKAITEQTAYDPMAISSFLFFMTLMEGNSYAEAKREVKYIPIPKSLRPKHNKLISNFNSKNHILSGANDI